ncbi:MAG: hypothetical protein VB085_03575 [Peptococcaceae bacterium]|nr:hypothetical protein [Peptococcaceae bacterium]
MFLHDLQSEMAFYGKELEVIGHLYAKPQGLPARYPDVLFFLLYTCQVLVDKKTSLAAAQRLMEQLKLGSELEKCANWEEERPFTFPARIIPYKGYAKSAFSATLMFKGKLYFRFSYMGFGLFSNGKKFDQCAIASVFGLLDSIYNRNQEDRQLLDALWQAAQVLGSFPLGKELNQGNCQDTAKRLYLQVTGDDFPALLKSLDPRRGPVLSGAGKQAGPAEEKNPLP